MSEKIACLDSIVDEAPAEAQIAAPALKVVRKEASEFTKAKDSRGRQIKGCGSGTGDFIASFLCQARDADACPCGMRTINPLQL
jgi:hypothetical protein